MSNLERIEELEHQIADLSKKVERLEKQLAEANEVIKDIPTFFDCDPYIWELCTKYLEKWGVK